MKGYSRWVLHGESKEDTCNIAGPSRTLPDIISDSGAGNLASDFEVREDLGVENVDVIHEQVFDNQCNNDKLDDMMHDVEPEFADTPGFV